MGPQASKSYPGQRLVKPAGPPAERARQEIDYGRRDVAGYVFGALQPATGAALTASYERRTTANWVDFLEQVECWIAPDAERVYAVVDNLNIHAGMDVLLFALAHPRWQTVCSSSERWLVPRYAMSEDCAGWASVEPPAQGTSHAAEEQSVCRSGYLLYSASSSQSSLNPSRRSVQWPPAGSRFFPESASKPFHNGIRRMKWNNL